MRIPTSLLREGRPRDATSASTLFLVPVTSGETLPEVFRVLLPALSVEVICAEIGTSDRGVAGSLTLRVRRSAARIEAASEALARAGLLVEVVGHGLAEA